MDGVELLRFVSPMGKSRDYLRRGHVQHPLVAATYWLQRWPSFSVSSIGVKRLQRHSSPRQVPEPVGVHVFLKIAAKSSSVKSKESIYTSA